MAETANNVCDALHMII